MNTTYNLNTVLNMLENEGFDVYQGVTNLGPTLSQVLEDFLYASPAYDQAFEDGFYEGRDESCNACREFGYDDGYSDGQSEGYYSGLDDGQNEGYDSGFEDGKSDGFANGYDDGYEQGVMDAKYGQEE